MNAYDRLILVLFGHVLLYHEALGTGRGSTETYQVRDYAVRCAVCVRAQMRHALVVTLGC